MDYLYVLSWSPVIIRPVYILDKDPSESVMFEVLSFMEQLKFAFGKTSMIPIQENEDNLEGYYLQSL